MRLEIPPPVVNVNPPVVKMPVDSMACSEVDVPAVLLKSPPPVILMPDEVARRPGTLRPV